MLPPWFFIIPAFLLVVAGGIPLWSHLIVKWDERKKGADPLS